MTTTDRIDALGYAKYRWDQSKDMDYGRWVRYEVHAPSNPIISEEQIRRWRKVADKIKDKESNKNDNKENTMNNLNNVLFLAPGYKYAMSVIANQSKELDRKKIPYTASKNPKDLYIRTDKVHIEIVYMDPVKWTAALFQNRDAVFGKKELVDKAKATFYSYIIHKTGMSLSKYIREAHEDATCSDPIKPRNTYIPEIKNVYFNDPMTVIIWEDGTKSMVRCQDGDVYSSETGLALCIAKKALGNMPNFNNVFRKWIPEEEEETVTMHITVDNVTGSAAQDLVNLVNDAIAKFEGGSRK